MSNISGFNLGMSNYTNLLKQLNKDSKIKKELDTSKNNKVDKKEVNKLDLNNDGILTQDEINTTSKKLKYSQTEQQTFWKNITGATITNVKTTKNSNGTQTVTQTSGNQTVVTVFKNNKPTQSTITVNDFSCQTTKKL